MREIVEAVRQAIPDARSMPPGEVLQHQTRRCEGDRVLTINFGSPQSGEINTGTTANGEAPVRLPVPRNEPGTQLRRISKPRF